MADLNAAAVDGGDTAIPAAAVADLRKRLAGPLIEPGAAGYDEARRVWNGMIDRRPALIARCTSTADVVEAVRFAGETGILLAVRGGGHNVAGNAVCDGGLVIDLSELRAVEVDPGRRLALAQGGARLGDVDRATQAHGLAAPLGVVSETGIAGLTLAGGYGWLRRDHGLSCDNLLAAEVVTAEGEVVTAGEDEHPDLLWGLRGGGGNFGVVTSFAYRLHPLGPEVATLFVLYPGERAAEVLDSFADFMAEAPEAFAPLAFLGRVPPAEPFPAEAHGLPYVAVAGPFAGDPDEGERVMRPLRGLGDPIVDLSGRMSWVEAQSLLDEDYPDGWGYYWKSLGLAELTGEAVELLVAHAAAAPSNHSTVDLWWNGGAMGRVPPGATAFGERAPILIGYEANDEDPAAAADSVAWVRQCYDELLPLSTGGTYLNFAGFFEEGEALLRASYGAANYERLTALKDAYDPENRFRLNGNVRPSS